MGIQEAVPANPGSGNNFSSTLVSGTKLLRSISFLLGTSAHVSDRFVRVQFKDVSDNVVWCSEQLLKQTASLNVQYSFAIGVPAPSFTTNAATFRNYALPNMILLDGYKIEIVVDNIDTLDNITNVFPILDTPPGQP